MIHFIVRILWWIENSKEQHLFETEILCNIINVFTVTFDQFNAALLNKSVYLFQKKPKKKPQTAVCLKPNPKLWASERLVDVTVLPVSRNGQQTQSWDTRPSLSRNMRRDVQHTEIPDTRLCLLQLGNLWHHTHTRPSLFLWHTLSSHRSSHSSMWVMFTRTSLMSHHIRQTHLPSRCVGAWLKTGHTPMTIYTANTVLKLM